MRTYPAKKLFTVDDYYRMAEAGILKPNDRVELICGEIIEMSPIGKRHAAAVDRANDLFAGLVHGRATIRVQNPNKLDQFNEPEPDISLLKPRIDYYRSGHPGPHDIYLVIEISDTTLRFDQDVKVPMYAIAGIRELWIIDLNGGELLVHRDPEGDVYKTRTTLGRTDSISPVAFPDAVIKVEELLA
jgi:Uma2 family endonuclease